MPAILGLRGTGDWATDERPKNFREMILWKEPNGSSPLTALMSKAKSESVDDPEYNWWEETNGALTATLNMAVTAATAALTVVSGALQFTVDDMLLLDTSAAEGTGTEPFEIVKVTTAATTDTIVNVTRAQAGTTATTVTTTGSGALIRIGSAFAEGTASPTATSRNPTKVTNYCQIFKTTYDITSTAEVTKTRTGDPVKNEKKRRLFDHSVGIELAYMFNPGGYETTGSNAKPLRFTGGLRSFLSGNTPKIYSTTVTEAILVADWAPVFNYTGSGSSNERLMLVGNNYLTNVNKIAKTGTQLQAQGTVRVYGMELNKWVIPQGTFYLKSHPLMNTAYSRWTSSCFILDVAGLVHRYLEGRDMNFKDNVQANDEDHRKGQWLSECGLEVHHTTSMLYQGGLTIV